VGCLLAIMRIINSYSLRVVHMIIHEILLIFEFRIHN